MKAVPAIVIGSDGASGPVFGAGQVGHSTKAMNPEAPNASARRNAIGSASAPPRKRRLGRWRGAVVSALSAIGAR